VAAAGIFCNRTAVGAEWKLGPEQIAQASGTDLTVLGYSVPSMADWNNDSLPDLIVGEGGAGYSGKVRVYINGGVPGAPSFTDYTYAQSGGADLVVTSSGCLGAFPRMTDTGLLVGRADGYLAFYQNISSDPAAPTFGAGSLVQGGGFDVYVGSRATFTLTDWNNDGASDLLLGALDGKFYRYLNEGTDASPVYGLLTTIVEDCGCSHLTAPSGRSSPFMTDLDGDGKKDLLVGNTDGELLLYSNLNTDDVPSFETYTHVTSQGAAIDLAGSPRSRPWVGDWNSDGLADVLIGAEDGRVHLYLGVPEPATVALLAVAGVGVLTRRRRCSQV